MRNLKSSWIVTIVVLVAFSQFLGISAFNCSNVEVEGIRFDLTALDQVFNINNTEESPPTLKHTIYLINPCSPLPYNNSDETPKENKCDNGTFICEIITHESKANVSLVTSVKSVAGDFPDRPLEPQTTLGPTSKTEDLHGPLIVSLHGGFFVDKKQEANITFFCDNKENITVKEYKDNILFIEWKTPHACGTKIPEERKGFGGFTIFLIIIFTTVALYLMIGAGYRYHVYRSQGWDLLPHRDFWRDVPNIATDLTKNLYNSVRSGGGNSGYDRV